MIAPSLADPGPPTSADVAVVGAGIVGLAAARELALRHHGLRVAVLEREPRIAAHQTGHSSGVIHSGVYYAPGSLKARLCVAGAAELYAYCAEHGVEARRTGKLIVATRESELPRLAELERRARENGVPGLRRLGGDEIAEFEPHAVGLAALHSPSTGTVDFAAVAASLAAELGRLGGTVSTATPVERVAATDASAVVEHSGGSLRARAALVCAGAWTDRLAVAAGAPADPRIVPFRGAYLRLRPERAHLVRANLYPVPDPELPFLGVHLSRSSSGEVLLGPTALIAAARDAYRPLWLRRRDLGETLAWPGTWRFAKRHRRAALTELAHAVSPAAVAASARRLVPAVSRRDLLPGPVGIRAQALGRDGRLIEDFVVSTRDRAVFIRNAPSPAATACLPLARLIADQVEQAWR